MGEIRLRGEIGNLYNSTILKAFQKFINHFDFNNNNNINNINDISTK